MNKQAYMDGYMSKEALPDPVTGGSGWKMGERMIPLWGSYAGVRDIYDYAKHTQRPEAAPTYEGPHDEKFTNPLTKALTKGTKYEFLSNPYKPEKMSKLKRYTPKGVYDFFAGARRKAAEEGARRGEFNQDLKDAYVSDPKVRSRLQAETWNKVKGMGKMVGGGALMGAAAVGIPWILSSLFKSRQQPQAESAQVQAFKRQLLALQQQRLQQAPQPMRLGLVDRGRV